MNGSVIGWWWDRKGLRGSRKVGIRSIVNALHSRSSLEWVDKAHWEVWRLARFTRAVRFQQGVQRRHENPPRWLNTRKGDGLRESLLGLVRDREGGGSPKRTTAFATGNDLKNGVGDISLGRVERRKFVWCERRRCIGRERASVCWPIAQISRAGICMETQQQPHPSNIHTWNEDLAKSTFNPSFPFLFPEKSHDCPENATTEIERNTHTYTLGWSLNPQETFSISADRITRYEDWNFLATDLPNDFVDWNGTHDFRGYFRQLGVIRFTLIGDCIVLRKCWLLHQFFHSFGLSLWSITQKFHTQVNARGLQRQSTLDFSRHHPILVARSAEMNALSKELFLYWTRNSRILVYSLLFAVFQKLHGLEHYSYTSLYLPT